MLIDFFLKYKIKYKKHFKLIVKATFQMYIKLNY